jgi:hypothetical protein
LIEGGPAPWPQLVGERVARVTGRRRAIKLSESDVPKCF